MGFSLYLAISLLVWARIEQKLGKDEELFIQEEHPEVPRELFPIILLVCKWLVVLGWPYLVANDVARFARVRYRLARKRCALK